MFFRNLTLFRFPTACAAELQGLALDEALGQHLLKAPGPLELQSTGFVSPMGPSELELSRTLMDATFITLGEERKLLPGSVLQRELTKRLDHIRETEGRGTSGRERRRLRDEILTTLLPQAFVQARRLRGFLDVAGGWAVIDTSSRKQAETYVTRIREALGSFPAVPVNAECSPRALMTAWVDGEPLPEGFALGDRAELRDPVDGGARVTLRDQELGAEEVLEHLKGGKQVFALELVFEGRLSFVLGDDLVLRKLRFLEAATEALEHGERDTQRAEFDAVSALQVGELRRLLGRLEAVLGLSKAGD